MITTRVTTDLTARRGNAGGLLSSAGVVISCRWWLLLAGLMAVAGCTSERDYPPTGSLKVNSESLEFLVSQDSTPTDQERYQAITIEGRDSKVVNWRARSREDWIQITPAEGQNSGEADLIGVGIDSIQVSPHSVPITTGRSSAWRAPVALYIGVRCGS